MLKLSNELKANVKQQEAADFIVSDLKKGKDSLLIGVTGSGKTFTSSLIIESLNIPTLVIAHNKTLAFQLYMEYKELFPNSYVEYFVSYYDYYRPESYIPSSDLYLEKDASINKTIEKLRHSTTNSLMNYNNVIVIASVSALYGLGSPKNYYDNVLILNKNQEISISDLSKDLVKLSYEHNYEKAPGSFEVKGDLIYIYPKNDDDIAYRLDFFENDLEEISVISPLEHELIKKVDKINIYPSSHYTIDNEEINNAIKTIKKDLNKQLKKFNKENKLIEAQRLKERVNYDITMLENMGYCNGIENYSVYFEDRDKGQRPYCLLDYFPDNYLTIIDESHQTIPQIKGAYFADRKRKETLVDFGFRLPSALDNRPQKFEEFVSLTDKVLYLSATPADYEKEKAVARELLVRPTNICEPEIKIRTSKKQLANLSSEIDKVIKKDFRTLVTVLTKKTAEQLADYLQDKGYKTTYLHSEIDSLERIRILKKLRQGQIDVLIGVNLLREGLDLPEVGLLAILDADKQGFLRDKTSLIQTIGRAARNPESKVLMYADKISDSMKAAIKETDRRRKYQVEYNKQNNLIPQPIVKKISSLGFLDKEEKEISSTINDFKLLDYSEQKTLITNLEKEMFEAADNKEFEKAIILRDEVDSLRELLN